MSSMRHVTNTYAKSLLQLKAFTSNSPSLRKKKNDERDDDLPDFLVYKTKDEIKNAFPVSPHMFFVSLAFWILMGILAFYVISYGIIYSRIKQEKDLTGACPDAMKSDKQANLLRVQNYTMGESGPYLLRMKPSKDKPEFPMESNTLPPIVTAITSDHFYQVQGLIHHIMEEMKDTQSDLSLIIYDIGLNSRQREILQKYSHCEIRDLDFGRYPAHVANVNNFAWRPIIMHNVMDEFGSVMYIEPTTRFKNPTSPNYLRLRGNKNYFLWDPIQFTSLVAYTDPEMFKYLGESRCAFRDCSILSSESIVLYRSKATWDELMEPWLKCALTEACISPPHAMLRGCFDIRHPKTTGCHRYDMSSLSIIMNRGVQYTIDREKMVSFRLTYTDTTEVTLFPEQPWTWTQIFCLILAPIIIYIAYKYGFRRRRFCR